MLEQPLMPAQTAAGTVDIEGAGNHPPSIVVAGLGGGEVVEIHVWTGTAYVPLIMGGVAVVFSAGNNMITLNETARYRLVKGVTAAPVSIHRMQ